MPSWKACSLTSDALLYPAWSKITKLTLWEKNKYNMHKKIPGEWFEKYHTTGQKFKACIYPRIQALFILKFIM